MGSHEGGAKESSSKVVFPWNVSLPSTEPKSIPKQVAVVVGVVVGVVD